METAKQEKIGVVGLGYVGLPLAVELSKSFTVVGCDTNQARIDDLKSGLDATGELGTEMLKRLHNIQFSTDARDLHDCSVFIVTVPTPVDEHNVPDLSASRSACAAISKVLKRGDLVIFESTVFPGATEEVFVPILETHSGLRLGHDFEVGYSPERINPGDTGRTIRDITKIVSASSEAAIIRVRNIYGAVVDAGLFEAASIKAAEAAKVIENIQRDINIALINEFSIIFEKLGLNTSDVLDAAATKWNFLRFTPGLVGGHCIGVDPYYLTHKAQEIGYHPELILAGRRINENMAVHSAQLLVKKMLANRLELNGAKVLILGFTFKENCPDIRNTKIADLTNELVEYGLNVDICEPIAVQSELNATYPEFNFIDGASENEYSAVVLAVPHEVFLQNGLESLTRSICPNGVFFDLKQAFPSSASDLSL